MIRSNLKRTISYLFGKVQRREYNTQSDKSKETNYRTQVQETEINRLLSMPRFVPTETALFGKEVQIVDACTYLVGKQSILDKGIYEFKAGNNSPYIIDCGANIGLSVIFFKQLYPNSTVSAFEPDRNIFNALAANVKAFGFSNVNLYQEAIWKEDCEISFKIEGGFSGRIPKPEDSSNITKVKARRLKNLLLDKKIDFLKIDIEGAEYEVLVDCKDSLKNVDCIFIEYHSHINEPQKLDEILSILSNNGFRYHIHEAYVHQKPFVQRDLLLGMDIQLDIFGYQT